MTRLLIALVLVLCTAWPVAARDVAPIAVQYLLAAEQIELGEADRLLVPGSTVPNAPLRARGIHAEALPHDRPFDLLVGLFGTGTHDVSLQITQSGELLWSARYPRLHLDDQDYVHKAILARVQLPKSTWHTDHEGPPVVWVEVWAEEQELAAFPWWIPLVSE